ncbi:MAG: DtxR family transcriptional regulator [Deltaproteobacteria bacterium]|nr:DtxR family transcriptional regulator [Deltaproteobacteria bacterium]
MNQTITVSASLEDYLEAIFHIQVEKHAARAKDIAKRLKVGASSVTGALRLLAEKGLINYAPYDLITLTLEGKAVAEDVIRRHETLRDFFVNVLAVSEKDAGEAACRMEHAVPKPILERLLQFAEFVELCPRGGSKWIAGFAHYCHSGDILDNCEKCTAIILDEIKKKKKGEKKGMKTVNLKDLLPGQKARVVKIRSAGNINRRIVEMGVTQGTLIEMERVAPLGDPIDIKVKGYHLSLRKEEAEDINVEII